MAGPVGGHLMAYELKDYVEVPERIAAWYKAHPDGRIVCEITEFTDVRVTVKSSVYRTSDPLEQPAGVGHSFLAIPGKTPYTKDSELENAETSAAGRALVMAGIPAKSVASAQEVKNKRSADEGSGQGRATRTQPGKSASPAPSTLGSGAARGESPGHGEGPGGSSQHVHNWKDIKLRPGHEWCDGCGVNRQKQGAA